METKAETRLGEEKWVRLHIRSRSRSRCRSLVVYPTSCFLPLSQQILPNSQFSLLQLCSASTSKPEAEADKSSQFVWESTTGKKLSRIEAKTIELKCQKCTTEDKTWKKRDLRPTGNKSKVKSGSTRKKERDTREKDMPGTFETNRSTQWRIFEAMWADRDIDEHSVFDHKPRENGNGNAIGIGVGIHTQFHHHPLDRIYSTHLGGNGHPGTRIITPPNGLNGNHESHYRYVAQTKITDNKRMLFKELKKVIFHYYYYYHYSSSRLQHAAAHRRRGRTPGRGRRQHSRQFKGSEYAGEKSVPQESWVLSRSTSRGSLMDTIKSI